MQKFSESRQRRWQKKQAENGLCKICPRPAEKWGLCAEHVEKAVKNRRKARKVKKPHPRKEMWLKVNWSLPLKEIAQKMGVSVASVRYHLKKI